MPMQDRGRHEAEGRCKFPQKVDDACGSKRDASNSISTRLACVKRKDQGRIRFRKK